MWQVLLTNVSYFRKWIIKMKKIWVIWDSHFNHPSIISEFEFRPKNYAKQICDKVRNNVWENDLLIHLWDVIFYNCWELEEYLNRMWDCTKILVKWNHDKKSNSFYYSKGFDFVCNEFKIDNVVFTHIPKGTLLKNEINVHWHLHRNSHHINEYTKTPERYKLYSAENENYMPIRLEQLIK